MTGELVVATASLTGQRHLANGQYNQDSVYYELMPGSQGLIAAVSDGAGSARRAKDGSFLAARTAVKQTKRIILEESEGPAFAVRRGLFWARQAIKQQVQIVPSHPIEEYHCTLVLIAWVGDLICGIQVGDGAAIVGTKEGYKMLTVPRQGEFANETYFITEPHYLQAVFENEATDVNSVALFTDGLQRLSIDFKRKRANQDFMEQAMKSLSGNSKDAQSAEPRPPHQNPTIAAQTNTRCESRIPKKVFGWRNNTGKSQYDISLP